MPRVQGPVFVWKSGLRSPRPDDMPPLSEMVTENRNLTKKFESQNNPKRPRTQIIGFEDWVYIGIMEIKWKLLFGALIFLKHGRPLYSETVIQKADMERCWRAPVGRGVWILRT